MQCPHRQKLEPFALLILRVTVGIIMATHGWQKAQDPSQFAGFLESMGLPFPHVLVYLPIAGELLGGLGLILGLLTPLAAFGVFCVMAVAIGKVHLSNGLMIKNNGFEYPLTLLVVSLFFMIKGAGCLSLDALFCKHKHKEIHVEE